MKTRSTALLATYVWLLLFALLPLCLIFLSSFLSRSEQDLVRLPLSLQNYQALLDPLYIKIFWRSLLMAAVTTGICLLLAYPFSYLMVKSRHQSILLLLIIIPFWTSSLIRTYSLIAILKYNGLLNAILLKLHLISSPLSLLYSNFAVSCGLVYNLFPFMVLPLFTNMERFDFRLIEAAKDLGASGWQSFWRVFVPGTAHGIIAGCIFVSLPAMTLFYIPNVLGGARSILLGNLIQDQFLVTQNWPQGAATSTVLTAILLLLLFFFRRQGRGMMQ
ncbi:MAG: ABC transporter permease subunit [Legionellaceae bacterium]|nr:ABC transporter permease subunit [Legionellaceae bacterium]